MALWASCFFLHTNNIQIIDNLGARLSPGLLRVEDLAAYTILYSSAALSFMVREFPIVTGHLVVFLFT